MCDRFEIVGGDFGQPQDVFQPECGIRSPVLPDISSLDGS